MSGDCVELHQDVENKLGKVKDEEVSDLLRHLLANQIHNKQELVNLFKSAFPGGDVEGHARYHTAIIEDINTRKRLTQAIQEKTISGLVWSAILIIATALYNEFKRS